MLDVVAFKFVFFNINYGFVLLAVVKNWFGPSGIGYGYRDFLSLSDLNDTSKGFLVNDDIIVEAEIKL